MTMIEFIAIGLYFTIDALLLVGLCYWIKWVRYESQVAQLRLAAELSGEPTERRKPGLLRRLLHIGS